MSMDRLSSYMSLPTLPDSFEWSTESWGSGLRCRALPPFAAHIFTTRQMAFTSPDDERDVSRAIGAESLALARQVHGRHAIVVRRGTPVPAHRPEADAFVSNSATVGVAVRVADCVPLLIADRRNTVVAAVHAGWRGTAARVAVAAVDAMSREFGSRPADLVAAIGPSIGACCYEVGTELVDAFAAAGHERYLIDRWFLAPPPRRGSHERPASAEGFGETRRSALGARRRLRLDVAGANRDQLVLAGVPEEQIHLSGLCTAMHLDVFTSYRAEKERAGRLVAAIRANS
jgi:YfiH family protein